MAHYRHLPIWKAAMDLAVHLEHAVRRFPRYHKYTLGSELRLTAQRLCITKSAKGVTVDDGSGTVANVIIADIKADNGVIHVIDKVLLPGKRPACH